MKTQDMLKRFNIISEMEYNGFITKSEMDKQIEEIENGMMKYFENRDEIKDIEDYLFEND